MSMPPRGKFSGKSGIIPVPPCGSKSSRGLSGPLSRPRNPGSCGWRQSIPDFDAVILSDYHIGTLSDNIITSVVEIAKKHSKKVIVDAQKDLDRYKGVYSMTPNLPDAQKHAGFYFKNKYDFIKAGNLFMEQTSAENVLITCGDQGMVLIEKGNKYTHIPVFNKSEVFDVTGAGDTVTALYTIALAIGVEPLYAAIIGNIAAGIVVKQFGCATTTIEEILEATPSIVLVNC